MDRGEGTQENKSELLNRLEQAYLLSKNKEQDTSYPTLIKDIDGSFFYVWFSYKFVNSGDFDFVHLSKIVACNESATATNVIPMSIDVPAKRSDQIHMTDLKHYLKKLIEITDAYDERTVNHLLQDQAGRELFAAYCTVRRFVLAQNAKKRENLEHKQEFIQKYRSVLIKASELLKLTPDEVIAQSRYIDDLNALYVWQKGRGGASIIIDAGLSYLGAVSGVGYERHYEAFKSGKRNN